MDINKLQQNLIARKIIHFLTNKRMLNHIWKRISKYISKSEKILDIGAGACNLEELLKDKIYDITPIDIQDLSFVDDIKPIIYNGSKIPFKNDSFDTSLILTVLHHTSNPDLILKEARRVSQKIIVMEDIYNNPLQKALTFVMDNISNLEFGGNPHSNRSDKEWKKTFKELNLELVEVRYDSFWLFFQSATYVLKRKSTT